MGMKKCPVCGEKYSDSYRSCPFCEEEASLERGEPPRRKGGRRVAGSRSGPNLLSPILIVLILLLLALLTYLLFGDTLAEKLHLNQNPSASTSEPASSGGASSSGAVEPDPGSTAQEQPQTVDVSGLPETLTLSSQDFTMKVGDAPVQLTVKGGTAASYTWTSEDVNVATVDESGNVTAVSGGTTNIIATDGQGKGTCIVRVRGGTAAGTGTGTGAAAGTGTGTSTGTPILSRTDFTLKQGESYTLTVSGTTSAVTWSVSNNSVATITDGGKVTGKAAGTAEVTATVDGKALTCIVRVN